MISGALSALWCSAATQVAPAFSRVDHATRANPEVHHLSGYGLAVLNPSSLTDSIILWRCTHLSCQMYLLPASGKIAHVISLLTLGFSSSWAPVCGWCWEVWWQALSLVLSVPAQSLGCSWAWSWCSSSGRCSVSMVSLSPSSPPQSVPFLTSPVTEFYIRTLHTPHSRMNSLTCIHRQRPLHSWSY